MLRTIVGMLAIAIVLSVGSAAAQEPLKIGLIQSMTGAFNTVGKAAVGAIQQGNILDNAMRAALTTTGFIAGA